RAYHLSPVRSPNSHTLLALVIHAHPAPSDLLPFPTRRSSDLDRRAQRDPHERTKQLHFRKQGGDHELSGGPARDSRRRDRCPRRSEEHTSELQSPDHLVCRLLLEKKKKRQ